MATVTMRFGCAVDAVDVDAAVASSLAWDADGRSGPCMHDGDGWGGQGVWAEPL